MDEVRTKKINLAITFYDYQNRFKWLDIRWRKFTDGLENLVTVFQIMMEKWSTGLEARDVGEVEKSRWINIKKGQIVMEEGRTELKERMEMLG